MSSEKYQSIKDHRKIFGHPAGLYVLFFTEMWERFSYYGMRVLLTLYMTKYLFDAAEKGQEIYGYAMIKLLVSKIVSAGGISEQVTAQIFASQVYGLYTGLVYLTPLIGGIIADRYWGQRRSVYVGGILMAIGHFLMAFESSFFLALFFLILGNGAFKPNISTQVGGLYEEGEDKRDSAFTIFYMGVNLGAFLSPLICGTLGQKYGWHYGFSAAGFGMMLGLFVYHWGRKFLPDDYTANSNQDSSKLQPEAADQWKRILALIFLCAINIIFWAVYEQQGNTMQLWADERTSWLFLGWEMPSTWFQSFNPFFIFIFAPVLAWYWKWQSSRNIEPTSVTKMGIGCFQMGISFVVMIVATKILGPTEKGSVHWLIWSTLILTIGELYLSPIGLSLVAKVAPARMISMMMGVWYLSSFLGNYLSGYIGSYYEIIPKDLFFSILVGMGLVAGLVFVLANRPLNRVLGVNETSAKG